jgi:uncharacterized repeat protein (TIGR01451 family)
MPLLVGFSLVLAGCAGPATPTPTRAPRPTAVIETRLTAAERAAIFETVWQTVNDQYFDPTFGGKDWQAIGDEYRQKLATVQDDDTFWFRVLNPMLFELGVSHLVALPPELANEVDRMTFATGSLGMDVRLLDGRAVVTQVVAGSPADNAGGRPGFVISSAPTAVPLGGTVSTVQSAAPVEAAPGETVSYTLTIRSLGPTPATGAVLTDVLSSSVTPPRAQPSQPVCKRQERGVGCGLGDLQAGDAATVTLDLHAFVVAAHESDPGGSSNRATSTTTAGAALPASAAAGPVTADLVLQGDGPASAMAGQPFTYTYTIANRGALDATGVWFEDAVPSDMDLIAYAPGLPRCEQRGDRLTCTLRGADGGETVTLTLSITGYGAQPIKMGLDAVAPGWPICLVIKERSWLHIVQCELGDLKSGQSVRVELVLVPIGVRERTIANTASVHGNEADSNPVDNTSTLTTTVQAGAETGRP